MMKMLFTDSKIHALMASPEKTLEEVENWAESGLPRREVYRIPQGPGYVVERVYEYRPRSRGASATTVDGGWDELVEMRLNLYDTTGHTLLHVDTMDVQKNRIRSETAEQFARRQQMEGEDRSTRALVRAVEGKRRRMEQMKRELEGMEGELARRRWLKSRKKVRWEGKEGSPAQPPQDKTLGEERGGE